MNFILTDKLTTKNGHSHILVLTLGVLVCVALTLAQDFLRSYLKHSAFYFSETLIFSSFWWIFLPLLFCQYLAISNLKTRQLGALATIIMLPFTIHLFGFPFLVWVLSRLFYYHTYDFQQTVSYTLSEHLYLLVLFYSFPILAYCFFVEKLKVRSEGFERVEHSPNQFINAIVVAEGNKRRNIPISEILYFSANPPYINIYSSHEKYLHNETLKSISGKLNPDQFVRIHKSTIVNIKMVDYYSTRHNGDYDLTLKNSIKLRVSRNFATEFKNLFTKSTRLTTS